MREMELTIGIYIVGSLYWGPDKRRADWRESRLDMNHQFRVTAPIRYGRLSTTRGNTYTMVFSQSAGPGQAIAVRCKRSVSSAADLVTEAQHLWAAETKSTTPTGAICATWGSVGLLVNEQSKIPTDLLASWAQRVRREPNYGHVRHAFHEGPVINSSGRLLVRWPDLVDGSGPTPFDLLLATATDPTLENDGANYASSETVVEPSNSRFRLLFPKESPRRHSHIPGRRHRIISQPIAILARCKGR
jgi:hypothetical protein